jgi:endoglucanase
MYSLKTTFAVLAWCTLLYGKGNDQPAETGLLASQTHPYDSTLAPMSLHVEGTRVLDANNRRVWLCGVNIASLEYRTDGDHVQESVNRAINGWKANLIRLPLAQDRWFGKMKDQHDGGAAYRAVVDDLVGTCAAARVYIDLDLHWSDCGEWVNAGGRLGQHNMPDQISVVFWHDLATRYKNHPNVIFGLYNEPHDVSWEVWRNGGRVDDLPPNWSRDQTRTQYHSVGMQQLYDTVRATDAQNVVTVAGLDWGYDLSGVSAGNAIIGTNCVYETHPYPNKKDWDKNFGEISQKHPVYVGEWGFGGQAFSHTNGPAYGQRLMGYLQEHDIRMWTAWNFSATAGPTMFKNWSYEPTVFGEFVEKQLAEAATVRGSAK